MKQDRRSRQKRAAAPRQPYMGTLGGQPLDGSQYVDVVEEQVYAESRPSPDAREPHDAQPPEAGKASRN